MSPPWDLGSCLASDATAARLFVYQRMLYSTVVADVVFETARSFPSEVAEPMLEWIRGVDTEQLAAERAARVRNLSAHLARALPTLQGMLGTDLHREWVSRFADAIEFWQARGRTLAENYCLYVAPRLDDLFLSTLARLDGTLSGLAAAPRAASPWSGEPTPPVLDGALATEVFRSPVHLLSATQALPLTVDRPIAASRMERTIAVALLADRSSVVLALDAA